MNAPDPISRRAAPAPASRLTIAALRGELGLTQQEFAARLGLANKASVSLLERGQTPCSVPVALAIEKLSCGRIDAASLSEDVRLARDSLRGRDPQSGEDWPRFVGPDDMA